MNLAWGVAQWFSCPYHASTWGNALFTWYHVSPRFGHTSHVMWSVVGVWRGAAAAMGAPRGVHVIFAKIHVGWAAGNAKGGRSPFEADVSIVPWRSLRCRAPAPCRPVCACETPRLAGIDRAEQRSCRPGAMPAVAWRATMLLLHGSRNEAQPSKRTNHVLWCACFILLPSSDTRAVDMCSRCAHTHSHRVFAVGICGPPHPSHRAAAALQQAAAVRCIAILQVARAAHASGSGKP